MCMCVGGIDGGERLKKDKEQGGKKSSLCHFAAVFASLQGHLKGTEMELFALAHQKKIYIRAVFTELTGALELLLFRVGMRAPAVACWFDCLWEIVCPWSSNRASDTFGLSVNTTNVCSCV